MIGMPEKCAAESHNDHTGEENVADGVTQNCLLGFQVNVQIVHSTISTKVLQYVKRLAEDSRINATGIHAATAV